MRAPEKRSERARARARARVGVGLVVWVVAGVAGAQPPPSPAPLPTGPAATVAVAPFGTLGVDEKAVREAEKHVEAGILALGDVRVVSATEVEKAVKKARRPELLLCEGAPRCLGDLATLVGAARVVGGDVGGLGDGQILYLKAVRANFDRELASTTATLEGAADARKTAATAAAFRLLAPERYVGSLVFELDVADAQVYLDGRKLTVRKGVPVKGIAVGTHALRVTHEAYHDWLRFVDVPFSQAPVQLDVDLAKYPIITDEMKAGGPTPIARRIITEPLPWYRRWWVPVAGGAVLLGTVTTIVYLSAKGIGADDEVQLDTTP